MPIEIGPGIQIGSGISLGYTTIPVITYIVEEDNATLVITETGDDIILEN